MNLKLFSLIIFIVTYILFVIFSNKRTLIAVISASIIFLLQLLITKNFNDSIIWVFTSINWNVMGIFVGTLFVADSFMKSKVPAYLAEFIVNKSKNVFTSILLICIMTSIISAFVENVATVLIVAPIALSLAKKLKINPMNILIAIAVSSNLQGTATLIGDPPSMLLGGFAKMNFFDFFFYKGKPSIFFAVQIGMIFSTLVLYLIFRRLKEQVRLIPQEKIASIIPSINLVLLILFLALASFFDLRKFGMKENSFTSLLNENISGIICILFGLFSLIWEKVTNNESIKKNIISIDWDTTFFLISIFILVESLNTNGWISFLSNTISKFIGTNVFFGYLIILILSIIISGFVDNVPFLAAMLPIAKDVSINLGIEPPLYLFALLIGSCLGGNITPIGASANIVACGLLKKEKINVSFLQFGKIGLPFTLAAVIPASIFVWFVWK